MPIEVVNQYKEPWDIDIGRIAYKEFHYGNPFSHFKNTAAKVMVKSRAEAVEAYRKWLNGEAYQDIEPKRRQWILDNLYKLKDKRLGCYCKRDGGFKGKLVCHGQILASLVDGVPPEQIP